jgi:mannosylglycerate hydrolase
MSALERVPRGPWRLYAVPHTHWDREWYMPLESFRNVLAHTVDEVLDVLERDQRMRFTLDGQAVLLEDYAEYRPDARQQRRIRALLKSGRLSVGPAYVQPDEFLVGGESLVRNLLIGAAVCRRHGAEPAPLGYAPDGFGHVAQMPQILRGFGLDHLLFMRGYGDDGARAGAVMWWAGADGSRVLAIAMPEGYGAMSWLGMVEERYEPDAAAERVAAFLVRRGPEHERVGLRDVLICNGDDHQRIQRNLPEMLDAVTERLPGCSYRICHYEDFVAAVREQLPRLRLRTIRGEQLSGRFQNVLRGVNSARLELKIRNAELERMLQSAETLASLAALKGEYDYQRDGFEVAWRQLLLAQPHDSICGCSVDPVHRDMRQRFDTAEEICQRLGDEAIIALAELGRDAIWHYTWSPVAERTLINVLPWGRRVVAELSLPSELARARGLIARTDDGPLPVQLVGRGRSRRALVIAELPPLGATPFELVAGSAESTGARANGRTVENELLRVTVARDGSLTLTDRATGRRFAGLHRFEDEADRGDSYTFCPLEGDTPWTSSGCDARVRVLEPGPLRAELEIRLSFTLPASLSADRRNRVGRARCEAVTRVRLHAGIDRVELSTRLINRSADHRLRVRFPDRTGDPKRVRAQSAFAVVERPAHRVGGERWFEPPHATEHTAGLVCAGELCLMTRGLSEYEAAPRAGGGVDLLLTLVRAVGWLSRDDLSTRRGGAGPQVEAPGAQGVGERVCEYALSARGGMPDDELVRATEDYRFPPADAPARVELGGVLDVSGARFVATALKGAEDGDGFILRVYNPGRLRGWVRVAAAGRTVRRCRLDETGGEQVDGRVVLRAYEILTLRIS